MYTDLGKEKIGLVRDEFGWNHHHGKCWKGIGFLSSVGRNLRIMKKKIVYFQRSNMLSFSMLQVWWESSGKSPSGVLGRQHSAASKGCHHPRSVPDRTTLEKLHNFERYLKMVRVGSQKQLQQTWVPGGWTKARLGLSDFGRSTKLCAANHLGPCANNRGGQVC